MIQGKRVTRSFPACYGFRTAVAITLTMLRRSSLAISIIRWLNSRRSGVNGVREPELSFDVTRGKIAVIGLGYVRLFLLLHTVVISMVAGRLLKKLLIGGAGLVPDVRMNSIAGHSRPSSS